MPESDIRMKSYDHLYFSRASIVQFRATRYIICLNRTSESKVMAVSNWHVLPCLISSISLYYVPESHIWVKSYEYTSLSRASIVQIWVSRYVTGLNRKSESNVMAVWICLVLPCLTSSILMNYAPKSEIRVKSYDHSSLPRASVVQIWASRYAMDLNRKSESKVMAVWICLVLPCLIPRISIYSAPESDFRVKSYDHLNLLRASSVQFRATKYVTGLNQRSESKVMAVWICLVLLCLISRITIYYAPELNILVKSYNNHMSLPRASDLQCRASRYIIGLNHTSETKVKAVWICLILPCLISSISIYYAPESEIRVKSYDHFNFSRASGVQFRASKYSIGLNQTSESKVRAIWIFLVLQCLISSISIYYAPGSDIRVKNYDPLTFSRASIVQFWATLYIIGINWTSESKLMAVRICLVLSCLISSMSIYCAPESDIRVKSDGRLNLPCATMFNCEDLDILCT